MSTHAKRWVKRWVMRTMALAGAGALALTGSLTVAHLPAAQAAQSTTLEESVIASDTNALRASLGLRALHRNSAMDAVARAWAKQMGTTGQFHHNPQYFNQIPGGWYAAGENIAMGSGGGQQLYSLWKHSPGHYANMTKGDFTQIGIGVFKTSGGYYYGVQVFGGYSAAPSGTYTVPKAAVSPSAVTMTGTAKVGYTVKASTNAGQWGPIGTTVKYQWLLNGSPVAGATGTSYKLPAAAAGKRVAVRVSGTNSDAASAFATSNSAVVAKGSLAAKTVKISGTVKVGKKVTAKTAAWGPAKVKLTYQWYANGKKIKGATKAKYAIAKKYKGKKLTVKVTGTKAGYVSVTRTAKAAKIK